MILSKTFYEYNPADVAKKLLGNLLVVKNETLLKGKIVETEAYYGLSDPASRAFKGKTKLSRWMWEDAGSTFVYMVHGYWLFNIITESEGKPSGVLIRAVEPLEGLDYMVKRRMTPDIRNLTSGPGKLTMAFGISGKDNGIKVYDKSSKIFIEKGVGQHFKIATSGRIGVREDLQEKLRFFIEENKFVSR
ncbi:MAG: DNA-3-methyladenine glycosylase [Candidatus Thermoplasmatota archaeon]|nr:DNA-3-methyladenine glycosylase [Candidatus Thermoplasmatota archaeon]